MRAAIRRITSPRALSAFAFPCLLILIAVLYYSQYYNQGFNQADEGNIALVAHRLLDGETPYVDVRFGAGLLWPYSVAVLFGLVGVDFLAMKIYFFCLATGVALLGYATVTRLGSSPWLGFVAGLLIVLVPGVVHKVFIPLAIVGNMYVLARALLGKRPASAFEIAGAAAVAALTFLLRTDLGLCVSVLLFGWVFWRFFDGARHEEPLTTRLRSFGLTTATFALVLLPAFVLAAARGFFAPFFRSFYRRPGQLLEILERRFSAAQPEVLGEISTLLPRAPISSLWQGGPLWELALLTYLPGVVLGLALVGTLVVIGVRRHRGLGMDGTGSWLVLVLLAGSAYPQFLLRRPDPAHLSQFMPGYVVFACFAIARCIWYVRSGSGEHRAGIRWRRLVVAAVAIFLALHMLLYARYGLDHPGTGSIARRKGGTELFEAANGVRVYLSPGRYAGLTRLRQVIERYAGPEDTVFCFPYAPGFNFMTDRRTSQRVLYASDFSDARYQDETLREMREARPAVVIISDWAVNRTEISRFRNWATRVMTYVHEEYGQVDKILGQTVYVRSDLL